MQVRLEGDALALAHEMMAEADRCTQEVEAAEAALERAHEAAAGRMSTLQRRMGDLLGLGGCACVRLDLTYLKELGMAVAVVPKQCCRQEERGALN